MPGENNLEDATWHRIVGGATKLFLQNGYLGTALEDIAVGAGISKATIYRYFSGKDELFAQVITANVARVTDGLESTLDRSKPLDQALTNYGIAYAERMVADVGGTGFYYGLIRLLLATSFTHAELSQRCLVIMQQSVTEPLEDYLVDKIATGELRQQDPAFLTGRLVQMLFFTMHIMLAPTSILPVEEYRRQARESVRLFLDGARST